MSLSGRLSRLLSDSAVMVLVVERCDWLTGFGLEHRPAWLAACGGQIVVVDQAETTDGLVGDVTGVLTWLCARRYGRRLVTRRVVVAIGSTQA